MSRRFVIISRRTGAFASTVELARNGIGHIAELFLLLLEVLSGGGLGILLEPVGGFLDGFREL